MFSVLRRIKVTFLDTIVRVEHHTLDAETGVALEMRIKRWGHELHICVFMDAFCCFYYLLIKYGDVPDMVTQAYVRLKKGMDL